MDELTKERLGAPPEPRRPINRWGDTLEDIRARQAALNRHWLDPK